MNKTIHIREAVTPEEVERFWQELHAYHARDIFPDPAEEDRAYFLDDSQYRAAVQRIHDREGDRCYYLLFRREGRDIGFALTALYPSEDGKCFVMEFCVLPEFRGGGTGTACARLLLDWAADRGAQYGELNAADPRRIRFWSRLGFRPNGRDEWGEPLMLRPPEQALSFTSRYSVTLTNSRKNLLSLHRSWFPLIRNFCPFKERKIGIASCALHQNISPRTYTISPGETTAFHRSTSASSISRSDLNGRLSKAITFA